MRTADTNNSISFHTHGNSKLTRPQLTQQIASRIWHPTTIIVLTAVWSLVDLVNALAFMLILGSFNWALLEHSKNTRLYLISGFLWVITISIYRHFFAYPGLIAAYLRLTGYLVLVALSIHLHKSMTPLVDHYRQEFKIERIGLQCRLPPHWPINKAKISIETVFTKR